MTNDTKKRVFKPAGWGDAYEPGTYGRLPHIKSLDKVSKLDYLIAGIPFDTLTSYRAGTRFGPAAIRAAYGTGDFHVEHDIAVFDDIDGADYGDFKVTNGDTQKSVSNNYAGIGENIGERYYPHYFGW